MKVWELIAQLTELPAGAEVLVQIHSSEIDKTKIGWLVGVHDGVGNNEPDEPTAVITLSRDISKVIEEYRSGSA